MTESRDAERNISFLSGLRAVRGFRPNPVPQAVVDDILEVARWSGSASNRQPWEIIVLRDPETLDALANVEGYAGHLADASLGIVLVMVGERQEQETYDEGRLSERIMLAAWAHGVGSSIGWIVGSGRDAARELLKIPSGRVVRTAISLGYPDDTAPPSHPSRSGAQAPLRDSPRRAIRLGAAESPRAKGAPMNDSFDNETLQLLDEVKEVHVETRRDSDAPEHRTIVWVVVVDGEVFVRSVRGPRGRWYREISANPEGALHAEDRRIPVRAVPATDDSTVAAVSEAIRSKYGRASPGSTQAMLSPETLPTTLKLSPA